MSRKCVNVFRQLLLSRWTVWKVFSGMVQDSLNQYRDTHNANVIRKQKGLELPSGHSPNYMWENCAMFDVGKCCNVLR